MKNRSTQIACIAGLVSFHLVSSAYAGTKLYSPHVEEGAIEFEYRGFVSEDTRASLDDNGAHSFSAGYGVTDFWFSEVGGNWQHGVSTNRTEFTGTKWENIFQIIGDGSHFVDFGFLAEYISNNGSRPDKVEFGPLFETRIGRTVSRLNFIFEREIGAGRSHGVGLEYGFGTNYEFSDDLYIGVQAFGGFGPINDFKASSQQEHRFGPVVGGAFDLGFLPGEIKLETGYMRGLTGATADHTIKWQLEYELDF